MVIPPRLAEACAKSASRTEWLAALPQLVEQLASDWSLSLGDPFDGDDVSCSLVMPATRANGESAVLKIGMPHFEGQGEIEGLRVLDGYPTVRLLEANEEHHAMLLERCEPGTPLRELFQPDQDIVVAALLKRFWRVAPDRHSFRPLSAMINNWVRETHTAEALWHDRGLVNEGLRMFEHLMRSSLENTLLATDLHAGNVLRAERQPWLVIDPKPFVGEKAYDATQHLLNCRSRLRTDSRDTIRRFADLLDVDFDRVKSWTFARLAAEPRDDWDDEASELARLVSR